MAKSKRSSGAEASSSNSSKKHSAASSSVAVGNGFLAVPFSISPKIQHWIYVRKHSSSGPSTSRLEDLPSERTLFIANLPVDTTEEHLREIFNKAGPLSAVRFRRQAAAEEEDEKEELAEGEDSEGEGEEHHIALTSAGKGKKSSKSKKSRVPSVIPLPPLDPRVAAGAEGFLSTSSSAHVVFLDSTAASRAMELLSSSNLRWPQPSTPPPTGLSYLLSQFSTSRPALRSIQAWANSVISLYQYRRAHPLPRKIGVRGVTVGPSGELLDEDGFIIVQRSGKYGRAGASAETGGSVGVAKAGFRENEKKKSVGLEDFYRFQFRERKREELAGLRKRFEADKEKVAKLKSGRRFKPY